MNLMMIPFHDWKKCEREGFRTRDAHLMEEFGRHSLVEKLLVLNRPISFSEVVLLRRNWRVRQGRPMLRRRGLCLSQVGDRTFTLDILIPQVLRPILMRRRWVPYIIGRPRVAEAVECALDYLAMTSYTLLISAPLFVPLVKRLSPSVFVLDALDNLLKHAMYRDVPRLEAYYRYCQDRADAIFANSSETTEWLAERRPDATWIPNGVDTGVFDPSRSYPLPTDMRSISRPIVGYAGKMQEMFDVDLMEYVVAEMPDVSFVFIGQRLDSRWVRPLWRYPNAYYLGDKPYELLPQYLAAFDVCIIPYNMQRQHGVDPIKFYEYLAMGKPVVTTDIGGVGVFKDYPQVRVAGTHQEFLDGVKFFIDRLKHGPPIEARPLPAECSWKIKADRMLRTIDRHQKDRRAAHGQ